MRSRSSRLLAALVLVGVFSSASCGGGDQSQPDGGDSCDAYRRMPCSTSATGLCDLNGKPAPPLTAAQEAYVQANCIQPR
jgi:hypothetical protein